MITERLVSGYFHRSKHTIVRTSPLGRCFLATVETSRKKAQGRKGNCL